ncbi:PI31 proteasome regulator [Colletotrichum graminicola]|uniref:PI31 proteasome regulator n=1 Tax=Colletotrichum graminicola (strain M1.001 / M2 / FGSC 10212) TaxID=645133 RepID=E3QV34_COLGM|nr:PI31 proteasome regulator [Colletotrichum graminicola M1.001]EFQ34724.1 PI31 proteasome regulator [Colletotrichum graminicola M1.001]WDK16914.1 PI31 proteasome regulator [Colletotrichum graminicola]
MANPLTPQSILQLMADALPTHPKDDTTSDISSGYELPALLAHACMVSLKFRLLGFDEEKTIEEEIQSLAPRLPASWNAGYGSLRFVYAHKQSSMTFIIRVSKVGGKVEISGLAIGHDVIHRFDIITKDLVNSAKLPLRITLTEDGTEDRSDLVQKLKDAFVSESAITMLIDQFKTNIVQKLIPKLQVEGYEESPDDRDAAEGAQREGRAQAGRPGQPMPGDLPDPARPYPINDPLAQPPRRPIPVGDFPPPDFEDEYEVNRPPRPLGVPGRSPYNIGHDDLNPPGLGPHDPLRPHFIGGGGLPRPGGGGGMHPTFDDPLFGGQGGQGGGGYDPQAPPGARWDPIGPGGLPRHGGGRGNPFGGPGGFGGFGGDII